MTVAADKSASQPESLVLKALADSASKREQRSFKAAIRLRTIERLARQECKDVEVSLLASVTSGIRRRMKQTAERRENAENMAESMAKMLAKKANVKLRTGFP